MEVEDRTLLVVMLQAMVVLMEVGMEVVVEVARVATNVGSRVLLWMERRRGGWLRRFEIEDMPEAVVAVVSSMLGS